MLLGYLLLVLIPVAALAVVVWHFKRRTRAREAAAAERLQALLGSVRQLPRTDIPATGADGVSRASTPAQPAAASVSAPAAPPLYDMRERVLTPAQTLVYFLLRTGLPEHVVFARISLAAILETGAGLSGVAREEQARRLAALTIDFVVCDRAMRPVAAIALVEPEEGSLARADRESSRTRLAAAGMRLIELDAASLPRKDALRTLVLGVARAPAAQNLAS